MVRNLMCPLLSDDAGALDKAMEMFSDLRQFDEAKKWAEEYSRTRGDSAQVGVHTAAQLCCSFQYTAWLRFPRSGLP